MMVFVIENAIIDSRYSGSDKELVVTVPQQATKSGSDKDLDGGRAAAIHCE